MSDSESSVSSSDSEPVSPPAPAEAVVSEAPAVTANVVPAVEQQPASELLPPFEEPPRSSIGDVHFASYQEFMEPLVIRGPEYGAEGLTVLWEAQYKDDSTPGISVMVPDFDIVVVHGIYGARRPPWKNPGSGNSSWLHDEGRMDGRKVMSFGYSPTKLLAGRYTRQAIRAAARTLLDGLVEERKEATVTRSIMFIAHDIGGIIVKDALTVAGLDPRTYGDIFDASRVLVFYGCPHRALGYADMEDRLSRFLFSHWHEQGPAVTGSVAIIRGLAAAVADVNNVFLDVKHIFRSYIVSMFAAGNNSSIDQVFDGFAGTLGMPFEIRIGGGPDKSDDGSTIEKYLIRIQSQIVLNPLTVSHERTLLCIAAPPPIMTTADEVDHSFAWIGQNGTYQSWFNQKKPQLLYVHGMSGVRAAAEYIFYDLDKIHFKRNNEIVLYWTFNDADVRRDRIQDMLTCFLAQIIGHFPTLAEYITAQFERLSLDRSWNDFDLLNWFEYYRLRGEVDGISCIISHFDLCEPGSRKTFLDMFSYIAGIHERPWRIIVTSEEPGALCKELSQWHALDLDAETPTPKTPMTAARFEKEHEIMELIRSRPELRGCEQLLNEEIKALDLLDPVKNQLVSKYLREQTEWPVKKPAQELLGNVVEMSVEDILLRIIDNCENRNFALRVISWVLYAVRPATIWEVATAVPSIAPQGDNTRAVPTRRYVDQIAAYVSTSLAGITMIEQHEIHISFPKLRGIMMAEPSKSAKLYPWHKFARTAHLDMAKTCIDYLLRESVMQVAESRYGEGRELRGASNGRVMELPTYCDRTNLFDYAVQFWPAHLSKARESPGLDPGSVLKAFMDAPKAVVTWSKSYWGTANPIKRSSHYFGSIYPLLTGMGMGTLAERWREGEEDEISTGLIEACLNGYPNVVKELLPRVEHSAMALQEALIAAGSDGNEETLMILIDYIDDKHDDFPWEKEVTTLVSRATWLGLSKVVERLLDLGCLVDPVEPIQMATPLHLVARTGYRPVAQVLLDHGANVKYIGTSSRTVLHVAAAFGHARAAALLASRGADVDAKDTGGLTAVYTACLWGNFTVVESLLAAGANPNLGTLTDPTVPQWCPLVVAAEERHVECARALLEGGADPNIRGFMGTPLRYAAVNDLPEMCWMLLAKGADPNHSSNETLLAQVVNTPGLQHRLEIIKILVENHTTVNDASPNGATALYWACWSDDEGMLPIIEYLIQNGADIGRGDRGGTSPVHIAVQRRNEPLLKLLLEHKVDVNVPNSSGRAVLSLANDGPMVELLLAAGADPNPAEHQPLVFAVLNENCDVARILIKKGARVDEPVRRSPDDPKIWTALALAVAWGRSEMVRVLGDAGANVNHTRSDGTTLVHDAFALAQPATLTALLEFRPDINAKDTWQHAPLHDISETTPLESVKFLVRAGADLDSLNRVGSSPLTRAVDEENTPAALFYLGHGANPNTACAEFGGPLHMACKRRLPALLPAFAAAGADVNLAVPGMAGTPLQCCALVWADDAPADDDVQATAMTRWLVEHGADPTGAGGSVGSAPAAAAWKGSVALLGLLLEMGAHVAVADPMGRLPVHFAAVRGDGFLGLVVEAGGDALARDKAGRTALHWAAQGGDVVALRRVLDLAGDEAVDQPDTSGWTALCWAARGCGTVHQRRDGEAQLEVVRELVGRGADVSVKSTIGGREWTPRSIAVYHGAEEEVGRLLTPKTNGKDEGAKKKKAGEGVDRDGSPAKKEGGHDPKKLNDWDGTWCDYCLFGVFGLKYSCSTCEEFDLCYKCHQSAGQLHSEDHVFNEGTPEYQEESEKANSSSPAPTEDTESSDDDSDSEEGGSS